MQPPRAASAQQIINLNKGGTNRDMEKMLKQINDLCDKLDG